jgi:hypothetical protein
VEVRIAISVISLFVISYGEPKDSERGGDEDERYASKNQAGNDNGRLAAAACGGDGHI